MSLTCLLTYHSHIALLKIIIYLTIIDNVVLACTAQYKFNFTLKSFEATDGIPEYGKCDLLFRAHVVGSKDEILFDNLDNNNQLRSSIVGTFSHTGTNDKTIALMTQFLEEDNFKGNEDNSRSPIVRAILDRAAVDEEQGTKWDGTVFECVFQKTYIILTNQSYTNTTHDKIDESKFHHNCSDRMKKVSYEFKVNVIREECTTTTTTTTSTTTATTTTSTTSVTSTTTTLTSTTEEPNSTSTMASMTTTSQSAAVTSSHLPKSYSTIIKLALANQIENDELVDVDKQKVINISRGLLKAAQCTKCDIRVTSVIKSHIQLLLFRGNNERRIRQTTSHIEAVILAFFEAFPVDVDLDSGKKTRIIGRPHATPNDKDRDYTVTIAICVTVGISVILLVIAFSFWIYKKPNDRSAGEQTLRPPRKKNALPPVEMRELKDNSANRNNRTITISEASLDMGIESTHDSKETVRGTTKPGTSKEMKGSITMSYTRNQMTNTGLKYKQSRVKDKKTAKLRQQQQPDEISTNSTSCKSFTAQCSV